MCGTCGCADHAPPPAREAGAVIPLVQRVLERNDRLAADTRRRLADRGVFAINLMSGPGAGKTTLFERTLRDAQRDLEICVIEGDPATDHDAERVRRAGARAVQVNTGAGCHLDAAMVARALDALNPADNSVVIIENVGNLVCPALFDLGEAARVVVVSVTDGDDKPLKYPHMFRAADVLLVSKIDLLPYVSFDRERCLAHARRLNPGIRALAVSATRGDELDAWYAWLRQRRAEAAPVAGSS